MKKEMKWTTKPSETNIETDIDDSCPLWPLSCPVLPTPQKRKGKRILKK
jgi:hypothetical protein